MKATKQFVLILMLTLFGALCASAEPTDITPSQKEQLKSLITETRSKVKAERDELAQARRDLARLYAGYSLDERKAKAAREKIGTCQLDLLNLHLDNQIAVRRIVSRAQFDAFIHRLKERRAGHEHPVLEGDEEGPMERLPDRDTMRAVGITRDQAKRILAQAGGRGRKQIIDRIRGDSKRLIDLYSNYDLNAAAARKLVDSIHQSQLALSNLNFRRQQALRTVLTKGQFDKLQDEVAKKAQAPGQG